MKKNQFWICKDGKGRFLVSTIDKNRSVSIDLCESIHVGGRDFQGGLWSDARKIGWSCVRVELSEVKK